MISIILNIGKKCKHTQIPAVISHFAFALKNSSTLCKIFLELMKNSIIPANSISLLILFALTETEVGDYEWSNNKSPITILPVALSPACVFTASLVSPSRIRTQSHPVETMLSRRHSSTVIPWADSECSVVEFGGNGGERIYWWWWAFASLLWVHLSLEWEMFR